MKLLRLSSGAVHARPGHRKFPSAFHSFVAHRRVCVAQQEKRNRHVPLLSATTSEGSTLSYDTLPSCSFRRKNAYSPWFGFTSMPRCGLSAPSSIPCPLAELVDGTPEAEAVGTCVASVRRASEGKEERDRAVREGSAESILASGARRGRYRRSRMAEEREREGLQRASRAT